MLAMSWLGPQGATRRLWANRQSVSGSPYALHGDLVRQSPELTPQIADMGIQAAVGRQEPAPEGLQHQVLAAHRAGVGPYEQLQDPELRRGELEVPAFDFGPARAQVEPQRPPAD